MAGAPPRAAAPSTRQRLESTGPQHGVGEGQDFLKSNSGWLSDHSVTASSSLPSP